MAIYPTFTGSSRVGNFKCTPIYPHEVSHVWLYRYLMIHPAVCVWLRLIHSCMTTKDVSEEVPPDAKARVNSLGETNLRTQLVCGLSSYLKDSIRTMINVTVLIVTISLYRIYQGFLPKVIQCSRHSRPYIKSVNKAIAPIIY